jgi:quercetin dioxygenase-like cupin family protein
MKVVDYAVGTNQAIDRYGSKCAMFGRMAVLEGSGQVGCIRLESGGILGGHPAPIPQMFCVIDGQGQVSGADGKAHPIRAGQAAFWEAGETHESSTVAGMTAIVIELASIQPAGLRT